MKTNILIPFVVRYRTTSHTYYFRRSAYPVLSLSKHQGEREFVNE